MTTEADTGTTLLPDPDPVLRAQPSPTSALIIPCGYCGAPPDQWCVTTTSGLARDLHRSRWSDLFHAWRNRQMWFVLKRDDERFGLRAGDIVRCVNYPLDAKVTVLFREEDAYDPECNQYTSEVTFLGFVPRDMETP